MTQRKELLVVGGVALGLVVVGFGIGRTTAPATPARVVTVEKEKEVIKWQERKVEVAAKVEATQKVEAIRVVTRWLRPDGTVSKEQAKETGSASSATSTTSSTAVVQSNLEASRDSERRTVVDLRARFHAQGLLGLDLGAGLERRWGGAISVRVAGPIWVSGFALPGAKVYGMGIGVTW